MIDFRRIELRLLDFNTGQIQGLPANPRAWTDSEIKKLAKSMKTTPELAEARGCIVVPRGDRFVVLGGNLRLSAAKYLKWRDIMCAVLPEDTKPAKLREIVLKDNSSFGSWDLSMLRADWSDVDFGDWGINVTWDTAGPIPDASVNETPHEVVEDDFDETTSDIAKRCKRGDIWQLGDHRLMCGDSTKVDDVQMLMGGAEADMVFTDPPYGIDYSGGRTQVVRKKEYGKLKNDDLQGEQLGHLICNVFKFNRKNADVYICVSPIKQKPFLDYIEKLGKSTDAVIVWDKKAPGLGYMAYRRQCEFILFVKGSGFHKGDKSDVDLWRIGRDDATTYVHGTQKPIGVAGRAINNSSQVGNVVLDYFGGSGSTLMACEQTGRRCYMMEYDEHYCDVIIARWEKFTGRKATKIDE